MDKKEKETERKIGLKNYLILALIFIAASALTLYLCDVYNVYKESKLQIPVIRGTLSEIKSEELEHYISEIPTIMLYFCTASDENCRNYEKDLKKYVEKENLQDVITYVNISENEKEGYAEEFNKKYPSRFKLTDNFPALIIFEEGKVTHLLQAKENNKLTITKTKQFMDLHSIGE